MKDYGRIMEKYHGDWQGFVAYCQAVIDKYINTDTLAQARAKKNPVNKEYVYQDITVKTKAHTTYGLCRALVDLRLFDTDIVEFLKEVMPRIECGEMTIHKDGVIWWMTQEEYDDWQAYKAREDAKQC